MADTAEGHFECPQCGRRYPWKPKLAGRAARCKCEAHFRVPRTAGLPGDLIDPADAQTTGHAASSQPDPPHSAESAPHGAQGDAQEQQEIEDDETYALNMPGDMAGSSEPDSADSAAAAPESASADSGRCPNCNQSLKPGAVICVKCGFNLQEGRKMEIAVTADSEAGGPATDDEASEESKTAAVGMVGQRASDEAAQDTAKRQQFIDLYLPGILIVGGVVMRIFDQLYISGDATTGLVSGVIQVLVEVVLWVPMAFVGMLLAVKLLDVAFGTLGLALYKLMGVALGPGAAWSLIAYFLPGVIGFFVGGGTAFFLYWALLSLLFDLDASESFFLIIIITGLQFIIMMLGLGALVAALF